MKLNILQQMAIDTGMLEIKLPVKSDTQEHEIIINGVPCDFCRQKEDPEIAHYYEDQTVCEACYEKFTDRWEK